MYPTSRPTVRTTKPSPITNPMPPAPTCKQVMLHLIQPKEQVRPPPLSSSVLHTDKMIV